MINPHLLKPTYTSIKDIRTKRKTYVPSWSLHGQVFKSRNTRCKTATQAIAHAILVNVRWSRLYDSWGRLYDQAAAEMAEMVAQS